MGHRYENFLTVHKLEEYVAHFAVLGVARFERDLLDVTDAQLSIGDGATRVEDLDRRRFDKAARQLRRRLMEEPGEDQASADRHHILSKRNEAPAGARRARERFRREIRAVRRVSGRQRRRRRTASSYYPFSLRVSSRGCFPAREFSFSPNEAADAMYHHARGNTSGANESASEGSVARRECRRRGVHTDIIIPILPVTSRFRVRTHTSARTRVHGVRNAVPRNAFELARRPTRRAPSPSLFAFSKKAPRVSPGVPRHDAPGGGLARASASTMSRSNTPGFARRR